MVFLGQLWTAGVLCVVHTEFYKLEPYLSTWDFFAPASGHLVSLPAALSHPAALPLECAPAPALQVQQCVAGRPQAVEAFLLCIGEVIPALQPGGLFVFAACEWGPLALSQGEFQAGAVEIQAASTLLHVGPAAPTPTS